MSYTDDYYFKKAKAGNLRARSYFKLEEIDKKFSLIKPGQRILDLGAAPGSWSQYVLKKTRGRIELTAVDLQEISPFKAQNRIKLIKGDVFNLSPGQLNGSFQGIISDMAPKTSGVRHLDSARSAALVEAAFYLTEEYLSSPGFFIAKYLQGAEQQELTALLRSAFSKVTSFKPKSSRKQSTELFFVATR